MGTYQPQDSTGLGYGQPPAYDSTALVIDPTGNTLDQFTNCLQWSQWFAWANSSTPPWLLAAWASVAAQVPATNPVPVAELQTAITQMAAAAQANAPISSSTIIAITDAYSQLTLGTAATNPPDMEAIAQLTNAILAQEPDWGSLLWINWDGTNLTVQVRGLYVLAMPIAASPWWTQWPTYYDAASQLIATLYLMGLAQQATMTARAA